MRIIKCFLLMAVFIYHPMNLFAEVVVGSVTASLGSTYVTSAGAKEMVAIKRGADTHFMDTYETKAKSRLKILFQDDSIITLGENSKIVITESVYNPGEKNKSTKIDMVSGSLRALVGKGFAGGKSKFEVHTSTSVAAARGTHFIVWLTKMGGKSVSNVLVLEGEVGVSSVSSFAPLLGGEMLGGGGGVVLVQGETVSVGGGDGAAVGSIQTASPQLIAAVVGSTEIPDSLDHTSVVVSNGEAATVTSSSILSPDFTEGSTPQIAPQITAESGSVVVVVMPPGSDTPNNIILNTLIQIKVPVK